MPVMGPSDNKENAEKAIAEIAALLKTKYHIDINKEETWGIMSDYVNNVHAKLKEVLFEVFKYDSWNGW